jgi:hypothetical protein
MKVWFTGHHPATDEPWKVIERAEFLLKLQPKLKYNLIGRSGEVLRNGGAPGIADIRQPAALAFV